MNRKPIFDAVRIVLGRGFAQAEVEMIDRAIDLAMGTPDNVPAPKDRDRLGSLSARFESGGHGPGTVSFGIGDPGGESYGIYQLSSRAGTAAAFVAAEGARWRSTFAGARPGTPAFGAAWKAVAARNPGDFAAAQHAFVKRTHYQPAVEAVNDATGLDLASRHPAVRDAAWSTGVQHGKAAKLLTKAVRGVDAALARNDPTYDRRLVDAIYSERTDYVLDIARRSSAATRRALQSIASHRYPEELKAALTLFEQVEAVGGAA